jgi:hypothetical protein
MPLTQSSHHDGLGGEGSRLDSPTTHPRDGGGAVTLKREGFQLEAALADLAPAVGPDTMILPVLNGMRHVDVVGGTFRGRCRDGLSSFRDD